LAIEKVDSLGTTSAEAAVTELTMKGLPEPVHGEWLTDPQKESHKKAFGDLNLSANIPAVLGALSNSKHVCFQCMSFAATMSALSWSIGVPDRMLTATPAWQEGDPVPGGPGMARPFYWNFHVWNEAYLKEVDPAVGWSAHDASRGRAFNRVQVKPTPPMKRSNPAFTIRFHQHKTHQHNTPIGFTTDKDGQRIDHAEAPYMPIPPVPFMVQPPSGHATSSAIALRIVPQQPAWNVGDTIRTKVIIDNQSGSPLWTMLFMDLSAYEVGGIPYSFEGGIPTHFESLVQSASQTISVASGSSLELPFDIPSSAYSVNGLFRLGASLDSPPVDGSEFIQIRGGFDLSISFANAVTPGSPLAGTVIVRNLLDVAVPDVSVQLGISDYLNPSATEFKVDLMAPGEEKKFDFTLIPSDSTADVISATVFAPNGGIAVTSAAIDQGEAKRRFLFNLTLEKGTFSGNELPQEITRRVASAGAVFKEHPHETSSDGLHSDSLAEIGLQMNPSTGTIVGTPTQAGNFFIWIEVLDADAKHVADIWLSLSVQEKTQSSG
jgi:hypothetical protein